MPDESVSKVLLIGWDAADWPLLRPLLDAGKMPNLLRLIEEGASGQIATLRPILSPMLWTSIATGKGGDKHGILGFVEPTPDGTNIRPVSSTSRNVKALWNILSQLGRKSVVVNWFASHPAEPIRGAIVSNRFSLATRDASLANPATFHPPDLAEVMEKLRVAPDKLTPQQMLPFFLEKLPEDQDERLQSLAVLYAKCASVHNAATYLAEAEEWDFLAVYYDMIDHVGHGFAQFEAPQMSHISDDDFKIYRHVMESTYRYHDLMLGRWMELAGKDTTIILLSDHGFYHNAGRPLADRGIVTGERPLGVHSDPLVWHRPNGVFVARGPGIKKDSLVHGASLLDITPTILALLGLPVAEDMEGRVLQQTFSRKIEVQRVATFEEPHPEDGVHREVSVEEKDPWAAQQALRQLEELGYIAPVGADKRKAVEEAREGRDSHLAQVYFSKGEFEKALDLLTPLLDAHSANPSYACRVVMCLCSLNRLEEAKKIISQTLEIAPHHALAQLLLAQINLATGEIPEADKILTRLRESEADMPAVHLQTAINFLHQRRWEEAAETCRRIVDADPDCAEAHDILGVALRHQGAYEDAVYEHMRAISLQHDRAQTHVNLALSLMKGRQFLWAIRAFEVASELAPAEPFPHRCLSRVYRRLLKDRERGRHHLLIARDLRRKMRPKIPAFRLGA